MRIKGSWCLLNGTCYGREHIIGIRPYQPDRADHEDKDQCEHHGIFCDVLPLLLHPESAKREVILTSCDDKSDKQSVRQWVASEEVNTWSSKPEKNGWRSP